MSPHPPRIVELRRDVLSRHDRKAARLRAHFAETGVRVVNLVSSPGTGKTALLVETLRHLVDAGCSPAALVGDCATDNDAARLAAAGVPVRQIVTDGLCHLEADMIAAHLDGWDLTGLDVVFIENVGNLVCPSAFDLGESLRVVLLSVTEGEDKPLKYPQMFATADLVVVTKIDLAEACEFDRHAALAAIAEVRPGVEVLETSARRGIGVEEFARIVTDHDWASAPSPTT